MHRFLFVVVVGFVLASAGPYAQGRPNLSGKWQVVAPAGSGPFGESFTATQTASTLTLDIPTGPAGRLVYTFNGGDTKATYPPPQGILDKDRTTVFWSYREASSARAAWLGDRLVIVTHYRNRANAPLRVPSEFESQSTLRQVLALEGTDRLIVESLTITDPDFDVPAWIDIPVSRRSTYRRVP